ncbi:hypothetical protein [uncultured Desulfosarcina sp.]|uniref:hypothetical protein n=1 Tax=uncultured Desulfosarcina sp. TaxID=218289 RepID=UPI0029C7D0A9|nr:hypothetical protein [uncultured Desulfosarcina sp.]
MPSQGKQLMPILAFSAPLALRSKGMAYLGLLSCLLLNRVKKYGFVPPNQTCDFNSSRKFQLMGVHPFEAHSQELRHLFGAEELGLTHESFLSLASNVPFKNHKFFRVNKKPRKPQFAHYPSTKKPIKQFFLVQEKNI